MPSSIGMDCLRFLAWHSRPAFNKANQYNKQRVVKKVLKMFSQSFQGLPGRFLEAFVDDTNDANAPVSYHVAEYNQVCQLVRAMLVSDNAEYPHTITAVEKSRLIQLLGKNYKPDLAGVAPNRERKRYTRKIPTGPVTTLETPQTRPNLRTSARVTPATSQKRLFDSSASDAPAISTKRLTMASPSKSTNDQDSASSDVRRRSFEDEDSLPDDASFGEWCDFIQSHLASRRDVATKNF